MLTVVQRASAGAPFRSRLRATLEEGPEAVDRLIRSYDDAAADHHLAVAGHRGGPLLDEQCVQGTQFRDDCGAHGPRTYRSPGAGPAVSR